MSGVGDSAPDCVPKNGAMRPAPRFECHCKTCRKVEKAMSALYDLHCERYGDEDEAAVLYEASEAVKKVWFRLHHLHRPDYYAHSDRCHLKKLEEEEPRPTSDANGEWPGDELPARGPDNSGEAPMHEYAPHSGEVTKFMVCDHCKGHGLPCNEAAICDQCQFSETACIHRVCRQSPSSRDNCPDPNCRYLHKDFLPTSEHIPSSSYIVLPGRLRRLHIDGKIPPFDCCVEGEECRGLQWAAVRAMEQQEQTRQEIDTEVATGITSLANFRGTCGDRCMAALTDNLELSSGEGWPEVGDGANAINDAVTSTSGGVWSTEVAGAEKKADRASIADSSSLESMKPAPFALDVGAEDCKECHCMHEETDKDDNGADEDDSSSKDLCSLCEEEPLLYCLLSCNHWMCESCTVARRALLSCSTCHICDHDSEAFIVADGIQGRYEDFEILDPSVHQSLRLPKIGARYDSPNLVQCFDACVAKMFFCPLTGCDPQPQSPSAFISHLRWVHDKRLCIACLRQGKWGMFSIQEKMQKHIDEEHSGFETALLWADVPDERSSTFGLGRDISAIICRLISQQKAAKEQT